MTKGLPVKACFKRRDGFVKQEELNDLKEYIEISELPPLGQVSGDLDLSDNPNVTVYKRVFHLVRYKEVKQNKGLHHIVATYEEI